MTLLSVLSKSLFNRLYKYLRHYHDTGC